MPVPFEGLHVDMQFVIIHNRSYSIKANHTLKVNILQVIIIRLICHCVCHGLWSKPEPNMLKMLPTVPSALSKNYPLLLFYSHFITNNIIILIILIILLH